MTIDYTDVKLFQSVNNTSVEAGISGARSGVEVFDGFLNNLFLGVSRIDAIQGELAIRGVHALIDTENNDAYLDAHVILSEETVSDFIEVWLMEGSPNGENNFSALQRMQNQERVYSISNVTSHNSIKELTVDSIFKGTFLNQTGTVSIPTTIVSKKTIPNVTGTNTLGVREELFQSPVEEPANTSSEEGFVFGDISGNQSVVFDSDFLGASTSFNSWSTLRIHGSFDSSEKRYFEAEYDGNGSIVVGVRYPDGTVDANDHIGFNDLSGAGYHSDGMIYSNGATINSTALQAGDIVGVSMIIDGSNRRVEFFLNGNSVALVGLIPLNSKAYTPSVSIKNTSIDIITTGVNNLPSGNVELGGVENVNSTLSSTSMVIDTTGIDTSEGLRFSSVGIFTNTSDVTNFVTTKKRVFIEIDGSANVVENLTTELNNCSLVTVDVNASDIVIKVFFESSNALPDTEQLCLDFINETIANKALITYSDTNSDDSTVQALFHTDEDSDQLSLIFDEDSNTSLLSAQSTDSIYLVSAEYIKSDGQGTFSIIEDVNENVVKARSLLSNDVVIIFEDFETTVTASSLDGLTQTTVANIAYVDVINVNENKRLSRTNYTVNFATGDIEFIPTILHEDRYGNTLDATSDYKITWRISETNRIINFSGNNLNLQNSLQNNYSTSAKCCAALLLGNLQSKAKNLFSQETFDLGNPLWSNTKQGDNSIGQYNVAAYPVILNNKSSITERWAVYFNSPTTVTVVGETVGTVLVNHNIALNGNDLSPINPLTSLPYFTLEQIGFGAGWVQGNVIRFNTDGASHHFFVCRRVKPGVSPNEEDYFDIECRGDI